MAITPEADTSIINMQLNRISGLLTIENGGKSFEVNLPPLTLPKAGRIPSGHVRPIILNGEDFEFLDAYEKICSRELSMRVGIVGTSESESFTGDTKSDTRSYSLMQQEAIQLGNFNFATSFMLDRDNIRLHNLQDRIKRAGRGLKGMARTRAEEIEITAQVDSLKDDVDIIELELIDGPQR